MECFHLHFLRKIKWLDWRTWGTEWRFFSAGMHNPWKPSLSAACAQQISGLLHRKHSHLINALSAFGLREWNSPETYNAYLSY